MNDKIEWSWSEEKSVKLIRAYRMKPILWDTKSSSFFNRPKKSQAWEEIAKNLNMTPEACKTKMNILLAGFRREKAKIMHRKMRKNLSGELILYKSGWFGFKEMKFLLNKAKERKRQLQLCAETGDTVDSSEENNASDTEEIALTQQHSLTNIDEMTKRKSIDCTEDLRSTLKVQEHSTTGGSGSNISSNQIQVQPAQGCSKERYDSIVDEDEIRSFTNFIGNKMKKYSENTKNTVQRAICDIIFKADQEKYERECSEANYISNVLSSRPDATSTDLIEMKEEPDPLDKGLNTDTDDEYGI